MAPTNLPSTDPFRPPTFEEQPPRPVRLEILEKHQGEKWTADRPLVPNMVRVNGVGLHSPTDDPIVVHEIRVSGICDRPLIVTLRLQARALVIGDATAEITKGHPVAGASFAVVEIPGLNGDDPSVSAPYAVVDGMKLQLGGDLVVLPGKLGDDLVLVELPLVCRSVVFDDAAAGEQQ